DPHRPLTELRKAGVIDHPRLRRQLPAHPPSKRTTHRHRIPRRLVHELLQTLLIPVSQPRRHRLNRLPLPIQHQTPQIHLTPTTLIPPPHRNEHLLTELHKPPTHTRKLPLRQTSHPPHDDPPWTMSPKEVRRPTPNSFNLTEHYYVPSSKDGGAVGAFISVEADRDRDETTGGDTSEDVVARLS